MTTQNERIPINCVKNLKMVAFLSCCVISFIHMVMAQRDAPDRLPPYMISQGDPDRTFRSGGSIELECRAGGSPTPEYTWTKNGIGLNLDQPNIKRLSYGGIAIVNATSSDQGYYECHANNMYGTTMSITYVLRLAFLDYDPPCWDYQEHSGDAGKPLRDDGNSVDYLKSFPAVHFGWEWLRDKNDSSPVPVQPSNRIQIDHLGAIIFANLLMTDNAYKIYRATAYNPYLDGQKHGCNIYFKVTQPKGGVQQFKPQSSNYPNWVPNTPVLALEKRKTELRGFFFGNPTPNISWSRVDGQPLPESRHHFDPFNASLTISDVKPGDAGMYECKGVNALGQDSIQFELTVEAAPEFRSSGDSPYNQDVIVGEDFKVNCNAYANPDTRIDWFMNTVKLDLNALPPRFEISNKNKTLTVSRVQFSDRMVIQCNASNVHGYAFGAGYLNVVRSFQISNVWLSLTMFLMTVTKIYSSNC